VKSGGTFCRPNFIVACFYARSILLCRMVKISHLLVSILDLTALVDWKCSRENWYWS